MVGEVSSAWVLLSSPQDIDDFINSLKAKLFQFVELFCTNLQKKSEEEVCSDLILMESICSADMADAVDAQVNNSESCPLLRETLQELRRRVCEPSGSYSPPGQNQPFDSSTSRNWYDWILELFKELLQRLQQKFQKALEWLHQIAAACLQGLRIAAEAVWRVLNDFCSSLEQLFRSLIQV
ncbi:interleukin-32 [Bos mutus]|uniref:interleukin-32 n=1 Tax=Bos mutus TaxID=72004 RepID=UPI0038B5128C